MDSGSGAPCSPASDSDLGDEIIGMEKDCRGEPLLAWRDPCSLVRRHETLSDWSALIAPSEAILASGDSAPLADA